MSGLSKSRIIIHRQCPKRLWLQVHWPELLETSDVTAARLTTGITVGEIARSLYPCGKLIGAEDIGQAIKATRDALKAPDCTIFEATFLHQAITLHFNPVRHFKFTEKRKTMPLRFAWQAASHLERGFHAAQGAKRLTHPARQHDPQVPWLERFQSGDAY